MQPWILAFDLESVLVPEIWPAVAEAHDLPALATCTRESADVQDLMHTRLSCCREANLRLADVVDVVRTLKPLPGAVETIRWARNLFQIVLLSDTCYELATPLLHTLETPLLLCHSLHVDPSGHMLRFVQRLPDAKTAAVHSFARLGFRVCAVGDSYNDLGMLKAADLGVLFNPPTELGRRHAQLATVSTHAELRALLERFRCPTSSASPRQNSTREQ